MREAARSVSSLWFALPRLDNMPSLACLASAHIAGCVHSDSFACKPSPPHSRHFPHLRSHSTSFLYRIVSPKPDSTREKDTFSLETPSPRRVTLTRFQVGSMCRERTSYVRQKTPKSAMSEYVTLSFAAERTNHSPQHEELKM